MCIIIKRLYYARNGANARQGFLEVWKSRLMKGKNNIYGRKNRYPLPTIFRPKSKVFYSPIQLFIIENALMNNKF